MRYASTITGVTESPLVQIATLAESMPGSIKLCYGESDMPTPEFISRASFDAMPPIPLLCLQRRFLPACLAREDILAENRAVIRNTVFAIQHDDASAEASLPQGLRGQCAGRTSPHDDEAATVAGSDMCSLHPFAGLGCRDAHQHSALRDTRGEVTQRIDRRWVQDSTGAQAEPGLVPGTDDTVILTRALRERSPGMRTPAAHRIDNVSLARQ